MNVADIEIAAYDYPLPEERIALHPVEGRDGCLLLHCDGTGTVSDHLFGQLPGLLPAASLMVCNNTRVINARLRFRKETGAEIEVFLLEPEQPRDYAQMFQSRNRCVWRCIIGNLKRWKQGVLTLPLTLADGSNVTLEAEKIDSLSPTSHIVELRWDSDATFSEVVDAAGRIPIPPYLNRESEECDSDDYQTVYSKIKGSVAAPTAGLHFTANVLDQLAKAGIDRAELTLHVGAGTFMPVKSDRIGDHAMHTEVYTVRREVIATLIDALTTGRPVTAVGTTSVRTLESLPLAGWHIARGEDAHVAQWEAYTDEAVKYDTLSGLRTLLEYMDSHALTQFTSSTAIMIAPGFKWRITDRMVTNFHQPESTLLLLVSSFLGNDADGTERWRRVYNHALDGGYRFLSYGDACLFERRQP